MTDVFPGSSYEKTSEANTTYVNENLTSYRRIGESWRRQMKNAEMASYSVFGHLTELIFVKTSPAGRPIKISELEDLDHL